MIAYQGTVPDFFGKNVRQTSLTSPITYQNTIPININSIPIPKKFNPITTISTSNPEITPNYYQQEYLTLQPSLPFTNILFEQYTYPEPVISQPKVNLPRSPTKQTRSILPNTILSRPLGRTDPFILNRSTEKSRPRLDIAPLVQLRKSQPIISRPIIETRSSEVTGQGYQTDQINYVSIEEGTTEARQYPSIDNLPAFVYKTDPTSGKLTRYLVTAQDESYNIDPDYNIEQQWLLFQRQGDDYDRLPERNEDPERVDKQRVNLPGVSDLTEGMVFGPLPKNRPMIDYGYDDEYYQLLEYTLTQEEEQNF